MDPTIVTIPLVGGPGDGHVVICVVGPDGRPPLTHWMLRAGGLATAPMYELESTENDEVPWRYCFRVYLDRACRAVPTSNVPDGPAS